ncbi:uncharacterized protein [Parasteatoda tepidariorum]|nr:uncharacterized protein LOC107456682 [Parasteatoda tepidariorum]
MQNKTSRESCSEILSTFLVENSDKDKISAPTESLADSINGEIERKIFGNNIAPYEKKYFALLQRCEILKQNNEKLINRIYYVKKLLRRRKKERKFLIDRLDGYGDDYRSAAESIYSEIICDNTPPSTPQHHTKADPSHVKHEVES